MLRKTILVLAVATTLVACSKESKEPAKAGAGTAQAAANKDAKAPVKLLISPEDLLTVQSNSVASGPVITGSVQPERKADLRAEVSAVVLQVLKENGDVVKRGDVLVKLDETAIRDSLNSAEAAARASKQALDQAERQVERMKTLRTSGMTSAAAMDDAEVRRNNALSDLAAARTRAVQARQQLQRTLVRAPFDGVVSERKVSAGDTASIGKELLKVIDPTSMRFEGRVSADRIAMVKPGQAVNFRINGYPGQEFRGVVKRVDPAANEVTRQVEVLVGFAPGAAQPRVSGLYGEGRIEAETAAALMLPEGSLVKAGDSAFAWRLKDRTLNKVGIKLGPRDPRSGQYEVLSGLAAGDIVMRSVSSTFTDGQKVEMAASAKVASANAGQPAAQGK
ncbi:efflux RND transporter periplasmic adaptor subunit [Massilia sp. GCM10020059]|uniref:Efflux RND transporter periplasmic adaptor subunit n=1 Tax=Massilia agrisoli TaxID=2892444 RepID=A0ABS8J000_9BURK|nr:efflux RND transporter periplasmic adaptor subunit [Massilia agrisoli]MCC6072760.1 efflux RND transporter periplasmic adaptor subunit [Massilia agrisoli]